MENASKTRVRFHRHVNGGFLEGVETLQQIAFGQSFDAAEAKNREHLLPNMLQCFPSQKYISRAEPFKPSTPTVKTPRNIPASLSGLRESADPSRLILLGMPKSEIGRGLKIQTLAFTAFTETDPVPLSFCGMPQGAS